MPRYEVSMKFTQERTVKVFARDEEAAKEKAVALVEDWRDVSNVEAGEAEEIEA